MSYLDKEDDEYLYLHRYLHDESDSLSPWMMDGDRIFKYEQFVIDADDTAFYEIKVEYRIRKVDGKIFYDSFI